MKIIPHYISKFTIFVLFAGYLQSCEDGLPEADDAQVCFTATLPADVHTRSFGDAGQIKTLVVGIFRKETSNGTYHEIDRKSFPVKNKSVPIQLSLTKNQNYSFVFWAYCQDQQSYGTEDLTAIKMNTLPGQITFEQTEAMDAFFATEEDLIVKGNKNVSVELVRPLAQINVGTTGIPMQASFTAKDIPNVFHPFTNSVSGTTDYTWSFGETTSQTFLADGKEYNYLAMGYVFAPTTAKKIFAELTLTDGNASKTVEFPQVEIKSNQKTNIGGKFTKQ